MKTSKDVLDFMFSEQEMGNNIVSSTIGLGGCGLDVSRWSNEAIYDLADLQFDGKTPPCDDIAESDFYSMDCSVYQFTDEDGLHIQILTY